MRLEYDGLQYTPRRKIGMATPEIPAMAFAGVRDIDCIVLIEKTREKFGI